MCGECLEGCASTFFFPDVDFLHLAGVVSRGSNLAGARSTSRRTQRRTLGALGGHATQGAGAESKCTHLQSPVLPSATQLLRPSSVRSGVARRYMRDAMQKRSSAAAGEKEGQGFATSRGPCTQLDGCAILGRGRGQLHALPCWISRSPSLKFSPLSGIRASCTRFACSRQPLSPPPVWPAGRALLRVFAFVRLCRLHAMQLGWDRGPA
ncbi:hypothetical protein EJ04DRAFT_367005 [Polyplosphaeria fusca]|uniref:Uncharacterized protein n=1 Tax=Polyplosphaeria fusca TaxID=682080 RepID=A0A9P4QUZ8_9PLEO|nr:hypothetical protein EJ04DRAFT_367005 [Polyplosphaeria fusca]